MRTTYTGPVKNRGLNKRGQANVSREELEDFKRKHGQNKTLRDLLNAELPGAKPLKRVDEKSSAPKPASTASSGRAEIPKGAGEYKAPPASNQREMSDTERVLLTTAGALGGAGAAVPRLAGMASTLGRSAKGAMAPRAAVEPAKRIDPLLNTSRAAGGKFRSSAPEIRQAAMAKRADAPATPMRSTNISSDAGRRFTPQQEMEAAAASMRGAAGRKEIATTRAGRSRAMAEAKAEKPILRTDKSRQSPRSRTEETTDVEFRKGGSVKGGGCETRGKKTRYV
jgi:hypothetical protein